VAGRGQRMEGRRGKAEDEIPNHKIYWTRGREGFIVGAAAGG